MITRRLLVSSRMPNLRYASDIYKNSVEANEATEVRITDIVVGIEGEDDLRMNIPRLHSAVGHVVNGSKDGSKNMSRR